MIQADQLEQAEHAIARTYQLVVGPDSTERVLMRARCDRAAWERFAKHHKDTLFSSTGYLPNVDPRDEPAIMTMLLHFFTVGAVAQRLAEGKEV